MLLQQLRHRVEYAQGLGLDGIFARVSELAAA
jgi:hypothetical protein